MNAAIMRTVRRIGLLVVPLCAAVAACGGSDSSARTQVTKAQPQRPAIVITTPKSGRIISAQTYGGKRLRAVLRAAGSAAPGQQLTVHASCGYYDCDGITFANADGRWHTRVEAITPPKKSTVQLSIYYTDAHSGDIGATMGLRLHKGAIPQANPQPTPPKPSKSGGSTGGEASGTTTGGTAAPAPSRPYTGPRTMIVIGDSLAVGMASPLAQLLNTWDVPTDARTGRPLAEGMSILRETQLPPGADGSRAILAFSLGTNDGPQSTDTLEQDVRYSVSRLGAHGCAIWATIARPPLNGVSYRAMNQRLYDLVNDPQLAGRLLVVPWAEQYARHKSWQAGDGVHATGEGYAARAQMYAQAARSCAA